jgi:chromosomal replication initiation ATPase DnaA
MNGILSDVATIERIASIEAELQKLRADAYMRAGIPMPAEHARVARLIQFAAVAFGVSESMIIGPTRSHRMCRARFAVAWAAQQAFGLSSPAIGRALGDRDHTTILMAVRRANDWRAEDEEYRELTDRLLALVMPKNRVSEEAENAPSSH